MKPNQAANAATSTRIRSVVVTFEPINHATVRHHILGTTRQVIQAAAEYGKGLARRLGVSPLALAVFSVREG